MQSGCAFYQKLMHARIAVGIPSIPIDDILFSL